MPIILLVRVGQEPVVRDIPPGLEAVQKLVGGYIEHLGLTSEVGLFCNDSGMIDRLPPNAYVKGNVICGDFYISRSDVEGNEIDLTQADIEQYTAKFALEVRKDSLLCVLPRVSRGRFV
jgi:Domain of unknown function (DUF3846)